MFPCEEFEVDYFSKAPVIFQYEREIPTSPEILFAIFEDELSWPKWVPGIAKVAYPKSKPLIAHEKEFAATLVILILTLRSFLLEPAGATAVKVDNTDNLYMSVEGHSGS